MRTPKNIKTTDLRTGILRTQIEVIDRMKCLTTYMDYNDLNGHADCKENRQILREIRRLRRYYRWLSRILRNAWR